MEMIDENNVRKSVKVLEPIRIFRFNFNRSPHTDRAQGCIGMPSIS
jgi:hypothetical protein